MVSGNSWVGGVVGHNVPGTFTVITACYWESTTAANDIGGESGGVNKFMLPDCFTPSGSDAWGTGAGEENGYWKAGTTDGSRLPQLWYE
jgi:hypothetical protein